MTKYCCEDGGNNQFKFSTKSYFQDLKKVFLFIACRINYAART